MIFIVDDEEGIRRNIDRILTSQGYSTRLFSNARDALDQYREQQACLVVTDLRLPGMDGIQLIKALQALGSQTEFIVITGHGTIETAVEAMKLGAYDYIEKPFDRQSLLKLVRKALDKHRLVSENLSLRQQLEQQEEDSLIIGHSPRMRNILEMIHQVAPTTATVLIEGESGTGKELIARLIHRSSARERQPCIKVNCAALPEPLLESELFGHEKGSFTGAVEAHRGKFEQADGGTIFLDEVGEMSPAMQVKLLRVLQEREFERVGGSRSVAVDVRVLAATNRNLEQLAEQQLFRQDLFFRLNVIHLRLPPLRERKEDIHLLAHHFLKKFSLRNQKQLEGFTAEALHLLQEYHWPGNIRELQNAVERCVILTRGKLVDVADLPERLSRSRQPGTPGTGAYGNDPPLARQPVSIPFGTPLAEVETLYVQETLARLKNDKVLTASLLGINLRTLYRRL